MLPVLRRGCSSLANRTCTFFANSSVQKLMTWPQRSSHLQPFGVSNNPTINLARGMARFEGIMPKLSDKEFVVLTPEVSGPGGMSVPAELGEVCELSVKEGDFVSEDAVVAVIDTCKASIEARCRGAGVVKQVLANVGDTVFELQPLYVVERQ